MFVKFWYKSCPRCRGDMALEQDKWGSYRVCIQCGYAQDIPTPAGTLPEPAAPARVKPAA